MKFPVIIIKENESPIFFFDTNDFGLISKGGENFYKQGIIYDSEGSKFLINGIETRKKAPLLMSIKYFQQMEIVETKHEFVDTINLLEFKNIIIDHIHSFKKYWIKRDLIDNLEKKILSKNNFNEIINFLR